MTNIHSSRTMQSSTDADEASSASSISSRRQRPRFQVKLTTNIQIDANQDAFKDIRRLLELFHQHAIPGPLLIRTRRDFNLEVGTGGQGQVRAASQEYLSALRGLTPVSRQSGSIWRNDQDQQECISRWQSCVIKQLRSKNEKLETEAATAVREVFSLCQARKGSKRSNYIVKLLGWGICLDALEAGDLSRSKLPFLVLERAECDMEQFVAQDRSRFMSTPTKLRIALEIGIGLLAIHTANMAHGDMKLSNILIFWHPENSDKGWSVKICDFGSASDGVHYNLMGQYLGTDTWRPPETISSTTPVDLQLCDIFGYGLVIWSWFLELQSSPIEEVDNNQMLKDLGQQNFYRQAVRDMVEKFGKPADRRWLTRGDVDEQDQHSSDTHKHGGRRCFPNCRFGFQMLRSSASEDLTRSFDSPFLNRILCTLSAALDEFPSRRSRSPWDYLNESMPVEAPRPPLPFSRKKNKKKKNAIDSGLLEEQQLPGQKIVPRWWQATTFEALQSVKRFTNRLEFQLEDSIFILAGSKYRYTLFKQFHRVFYDILGGNFDDVESFKHADHDQCKYLSQSNINLLRRLISRNYSESIVQRYIHILRSAFSKDEELPVTRQWNEPTIYSLARIRSRFADETCWDALFVLDPALRYQIETALANTRISSCTNSLPWAFRHLTALDVPEAQHMDCFGFLRNDGLSDDERTFRMLLLLEKGFFLGQTFEIAGEISTVFWHYLVRLRDPRSALPVCQHFRRIASLDGVRDVSKFYYTGILDTSNPQALGEHFNTCLHDAVNALNHHVTEYLIKTDFDANAVNSSGRTAYEILKDVDEFEVLRHSPSPSDDAIPSERRRREIVYLFSNLSKVKSGKGDLPRGWEKWPTEIGSPAYIETSTNLESVADSPTHPYPITFNKPLTGLYSSNVIALVERVTSRMEREPFLFNPLRFLRPKGQIPKDLEPAKTAHFDEDWYKSDVAALHGPLKSGSVRDTGPGTPKMLVLLNLVIDFLRWNHIDSLTRFLLSGDILILFFVPLSFGARYGNWSLTIQFWLSMIALAGVYARVWHVLDYSRFGDTPAFVRNGLRIGGVELDQMYNGATSLLDFTFALLLSLRTRPYYPTAFVVGNLLTVDLLILGITALIAGVFSWRSTWSETAGYSIFACNSLLIFASTFIFFVDSKTSSSLADPLHTPHAAVFVSSHAAAIISVITALSFHMFSLKTHNAIFSDYDESIIEFTTGEETVRVNKASLDSIPRTAISAGIVFVLHVIVAENVVKSIADLDKQRSTPGSFSSSSLSPAFATMVLAPLISKLLITVKIAGLGALRRFPVVIMRTLGSSVNQGLLVLPLLIIVGWCLGGRYGEGDDAHELLSTYNLSGGQCLFVFIRWYFTSVTLSDGRSHWFKALCILGLYAVYVMYAVLFETP